MTSLLAFDLETHLIQSGLLAPPIVCASWASDLPGGARGWLEAPDLALTRLEKALENPEIILIGANIAYDFGCVLATRPELLPLVWKTYKEERVFDVQIAATLNAIYDGRLRDGELFRMDGTRNPTGRYSLAECVLEWLGRADAKKNDRWRLSYALLERTPIAEWPEDARQYPVDDAVNTLEVCKAQLGGAKNLNNLGPQVHAAFCAHLGAMWGLRTEPKYVEGLKLTIENHLAEGRVYAQNAGLLKVGGTKKKPKLTKDTRAIKELVYKAYDGLPPTTPSGEVSISRETLVDSGDKTLETFAEMGKWEKLLTYVPTLEEAARGPLNVKCNILLATGRTSYDGLLQLIPRKGGVRESFVARPGHVLSSVDYAAIEMSTLAEVCLRTVGWSKLAEAINDGKDVHSLLGAQLLGIEYEEFLRRLSLEDPEVIDVRQAGKAANFGFPGMMGPAKFVLAKRREGESVCEWLERDGKCGVMKLRQWEGRDIEAPLCSRCLEIAAKLRPQYLQKWSEVPLYWKWVQAQIAADGGLTHFESGRFRGDLRPAQGANTLFQGLAADGAKRAVVQMTEEMYLDRSSPLFGSRLLVFAHDETILEIPEERMHEAAMRQAEVMVEQMRTVVKNVRVSAEPALMRRWYKKAKAVYAEGKLVPWEPKS